MFHTILIVVAAVLFVAAAAIVPSPQRDRLVYTGLAAFALSFLFVGR